MELAKYLDLRDEADAHSLLFGEFEAAIVREPGVPTAPPVPTVPKKGR